MPEDIVPELLEKIKRTFQRNLAKNRKIKSIQKKVDKGTATHIDSEKYGIEVGKCLADSFQENLSSEALPDGKMYYNISERIVNDRLHENHRMIHENTKKINQQLAKEANININVDSPVNQERIDDIINKVSFAETFDDIKRVLDAPVINFSQSVVDDFIQVNADFQYKAGMRPKITRIVTGHKPCEWCKGLGGVYDYPNVNRDIYRRHDNCRCLVDYHPGDGRVQNVHSKHWQSNDTIFEKEERKLLGLKVNNVSIKELSAHSFKRIEQRQINTEEIKEAILDPLKISDTVEDEDGNRSFKVIGDKATVVINPDTGKIVTTWKTSTRLRNKYR